MQVIQTIKVIGGLFVLLLMGALLCVMLPDQQANNYAWGSLCITAPGVLILKGIEMYLKGK